MAGILQPRIMPNVRQPPWPDVPFEEAGHINVYERSGLAVLEQKDGVRDVLSDGRDKRELVLIVREGSSMFVRVLGQCTYGTSPATPKANRLHYLL